MTIATGFSGENVRLRGGDLGSRHRGAAALALGGAGDHGDAGGNAQDAQPQQDAACLNVRLLDTGRLARARGPVFVSAASALETNREVARMVARAVRILLSEWVEAHSLPHLLQKPLETSLS